MRPDHRSIYDAVERLGKRIDDAERQRGIDSLVIQRTGTQFQEFSGKLDGVIKTLGSEGSDEYGRAVGTGLTGRIMRVERTVHNRDDRLSRWTNRIIGAMAAVGLAASIIWWLVKDRAHALIGG